MTDNDALLLAILADPDDAVRLVYADWLEEHGDAERAEFIRVQCLLERLPEDTPQRPELEDRCDDLLAEHELRWLGPPPACLKRWAFRRGFVESLTLREEPTLDDCAAL